MTYDYNRTSKTRMSITLENGVKVEGEFLELRISVDTIPDNKEWYQIRHSDEDWIEPVSLKRGGIMVNFMGTFICNPIESMKESGIELDIIDYKFFD